MSDGAAPRRYVPRRRFFGGVRNRHTLDHELAQATTTRPKASAWLELRLYLEARRELQEVAARPASHWYACAYGKETALHFARLECQQRHANVLEWASRLRERVNVWLTEDERSWANDSKNNRGHFGRLRRILEQGSTQ